MLMKKTINLMTLAALAACLALALPANAYDFERYGIYYQFSSGTDVTVVNNGEFNSYSGNIEVPETVTYLGTTYTVTTIGYQSFKDCADLTSIKLPESIEYIMNEAFMNCTSLTNVTIPSSVLSMYQNIFKGCTSLADVRCLWTTARSTNANNFDASTYANATLHVPFGSKSSYQGTAPWYNFDNIQEDKKFMVDGIYYNITGTNTVEVTYKDNNFNYYSGDITIPSSVTFQGVTYQVKAIGRMAFRDSPDLTGITIPNTVTSIDYGAFYFCSNLTAVVIPNSVTLVDDFAFMNCTALSSLTIGNSVTFLGRQCFLQCTSLTQVTIPSSVREISYFAFYDCENLTSVTIQNGVETIQNSAFELCTSLPTISIPASVTTIAETVLGGCTSLSYIYVSSGNTHYRSQNGVLFTAALDSLVAYPNMLGTDYQVPAGTKGIYRGAFFGCDNLHSVTLPEGLTSVGDIAFESCDKLTTVHVPASVSAIGVSAWARCASLVEIDVDPGNQDYMSNYGVLYTGDGKTLLQYPCARPDKHYSILNSTDSLDYDSFTGTTLLRSVYIPSGIKKITEACFRNSSVERVVIDEGVETIGQDAFGNCSSLKSVYLPSTIKQIEALAFEMDTEVADITIASPAPPTVGSNAFYAVGLHEDFTFYVPGNAVSDYQSHNWLSSYFNPNVNMISTLQSGKTFTVDSLEFTTIDDNHNVNVTDATSTGIMDPGIPPKVPYIGNLCTVKALASNSLMNCSSMVRAEVPFTVTEIGGYAFYGCTNLQTLRLHEGLKQIGQFSLSHINALTSLSIPASVDSIIGSAFCYSPNLQEILVHPYNTKYTSIDGVLFSKDRSMLVAFPNGKTTRYTIPDGTATIGSVAFRGASGLQEVVMPTTLRTIKSSAFFDNTGLTTVIVPEGVTTIESSAFSGCTGITQAELPSTLTSLGYLAFNNTPQLQKLMVKATVPPVCQQHYDSHTHVFYEPFTDSHYTNTQLVVPTGTATTYGNTAIWKKFQHISETTFVTDAIRGDVDGDGEVAISDVSALIDYLLTGGNIVLEAADADLDGEVSISDVSALIDYLLTSAWPMGGIDMWYLIGSNVGTIEWDNSGPQCVGQSLIPLFPTGEFDDRGRGTLTYTGFFSHYDYLLVLHTPGNWDDRWGVDQNGNFVHGNSDQVQSFTVSADGYYVITLDTRTDTFTVEPYTGPSPVVYGSITMVGTHNDWAVDDANFHMTNLNPFKNNHDWLFRNCSFNGYNELKFSADDGWGSNWGGLSFPRGDGLWYGPNIVVEAGIYDVYFNDITGGYHFIKK